jgi:hypothetical protein
MRVDLAAATMGAILLSTGVYAATHFNPPAHADPGGVTFCWLTIASMVLLGLSSALVSVRRPRP